MKANPIKSRSLIMILMVICGPMGFVSCNDEAITAVDDERLRSYELIALQWKLSSGDGQIIVEKKLPEYHFRNDSDTIVEVIIEPLKHLEGSSRFTFNDSLTYAKLNYPEIQVSIPKELSLLSEKYGYLSGGIKAPLRQEESFFPFSSYIKKSFALTKKTMLTTHYTIYLRENKATFLATFKETTTGEILDLDGTWTGLFFNHSESASLIEDIE